MIVVVSKSRVERTAYVALCESRGWPAAACDSVRAFVQVLHRSAPAVVVVRHQLADGFSDNILSALNAGGFLSRTRVIVLLPAGVSAASEARQVTLGADCVQRDPIRTEVLIAYLEKFRSAARQARRLDRKAPAAELAFAGASLRVDERTCTHDGRRISLTPKEVQLIELLAFDPGHVVTYETLYAEILGRPFRGDTSNLRVLLGKLAASLRGAGIDVRAWVTVIPKAGYRYDGQPAGVRRSERPRAAP